MTSDSPYLSWADSPASSRHPRTESRFEPQNPQRSSGQPASIERATQGMYQIYTPAHHTQ